jgi:hypothetical protein
MEGMINSQIHPWTLQGRCPKQINTTRVRKWSRYRQLVLIVYNSTGSTGSNRSRPVWQGKGDADIAKWLNRMALYQRTGETVS